MIRNSMNSLVHGEMSLGDAFVNEESITAVILTVKKGTFPLSVTHSFQSPAYQETRRFVEPTTERKRKGSDDYPSASPSNMVRPVFSFRADAAEVDVRPFKKRKHEHFEFVETASKVNDEEEEEEDGDSEDSYESSFVVDDDVIEHDTIKDHYLDLEAEEGSESEPSTESEGEGEDITEQRSNRPRSRRIVDDEEVEEHIPQPDAGKLKDRLQKLLQKQMDKDQARQPRSGVIDAAKEMPTPDDSASQLSSEALKKAEKAEEELAVNAKDTLTVPGKHFLDFQTTCSFQWYHLKPPQSLTSLTVKPKPTQANLIRQRRSLMELLQESLCLKVNLKRKPMKWRMQSPSHLPQNQMLNRLKWINRHLSRSRLSR